MHRSPKSDCLARRLFIPVFFQFFLALFIVGCQGPSSAAEPRYGGILRTAFPAEPRFLDPQMGMGDTESNLVGNLYNTLL
ncbi:MAG: hypothetical protein HXY45_11300, partial [Syntrophaceae bacterium]|nr:hypothetical protein [Syntrophaceae bacterium]